MWGQKTKQGLSSHPAFFILSPVIYKLLPYKVRIFVQAHSHISVIRLIVARRTIFTISNRKFQLQLKGSPQHEMIR
jgi:hypothetical protein